MRPADQESIISWAGALLVQKLCDQGQADGRDRRAGFPCFLKIVRGCAIRDLAVNIDAPLVTCHTDQKLAKGNRTNGFEFHSIVYSLDVTDEPLVMLLLLGNA